MMALNNFVNFFPAAMLGLFISILVDIYSSGIKPSQFDIKKWGDDNLWRFLIAFTVITACVVLGDTVSVPILGFKLQTGSAFLCGLGSDTLVGAITKRNNKTKNDRP
jgi:hypothetical protein